MPDVSLLQVHAVPAAPAFYTELWDLGVTQPALESAVCGRLAAPDDDHSPASARRRH